MSILPQLYIFSKTFIRISYVTFCNVIEPFSFCSTSPFCNVTYPLSILLHTLFLQRYKTPFYYAPHTLSTTLWNPFLIRSTHPFRNVTEPLSETLQNLFPLQRYDLFCHVTACPSITLRKFLLVTLHSLCISQNSFLHATEPFFLHGPNIIIVINMWRIDITCIMNPQHFSS